MGWVCVLSVVESVEGERWGSVLSVVESVEGEAPPLTPPRRNKGEDRRR